MTLDRRLNACQPGGSPPAVIEGEGHEKNSPVVNETGRPLPGFISTHKVGRVDAPARIGQNRPASPPPGHRRSHVRRAAHLRVDAAFSERALRKV